MKKLLWLATLFGFIFIFHQRVSSAPAQTYTFPNNYPATISITSATSVTGQVTLPYTAGKSYAANVCVVVDPSSLCNSTNLFSKASAPYGKADTVSFTLNKLDPTKPYFLVIQSVGNNVVREFFTGNQQFTSTPIATSSKSSSGNSVVVKTNMSPSIYPYYRELSASLVYSTSSDLSNPIAGGAIPGRQESDPNSSTGINTTDSPGSFFWTLNAQPSTLYYFQVTIKSGLGATISSAIDTVNGSDGVTIAPGSVAAAADLNKRSYTLLSGFPNFTSLPDPDLCAQERAAGQIVQFCDINDVLNYFLKLMVGITGVVLVFRLMYEGYVIMTTDVPFLGASSKNAFFTALGGLLLALCSYIILNTINPKLVSESINVQQLSIGVTAPDTDQTPITQDTGAPTGPSGACTAGITTVTVQKSTFHVCSSYTSAGVVIPVAANLRTMLTSAYNAGITLQGGGYRSAASQTALRKQNCNGDTTNSAAACTPPTAPVGHSNHESGLAFDFTCNGGGTIKSQSNTCFQWLRANAATYKFYNFQAEPWHWSWNGH